MILTFVLSFIAIRAQASTVRVGSLVPFAANSSACLLNAQAELALYTGFAPSASETTEPQTKVELEVRDSKSNDYDGLTVRRSPCVI